MKIMEIVWNRHGAVKTIVLAVIFFALLATTIVQRAQRRAVEKRQREIEAAPMVTDFNPDEVYSIEIYELLSKTVLEKRGGRWGVGTARIIPNYSQSEKEAAEITAWDRADEDAIREVLETVKTGLSGKELVSRNRERKIEFRVGVLGSRFIFKNEAGEPLHCVDVGEKSSDFTGTYVSICDEDEVYKVPGILEYIFKRDVNGWRDKTVHELDKEKIVKLEAKGPNWTKPVIVEKNEEGIWTGTSPRDFAVDEAHLDALLNRFSRYKARGFPERLGPDGDIQTVKLEITGTMNDGKTYTLTFGNAEQSPEELVKGSEYGIIYVPNYNDIEGLITNFDDLITGSESEGV